MTIIKSIKKSKNIFTALDIGSSKISCLIGKSVDDNDIQVQVLGFGQHASFGVNNGLVTNMHELAHSISRAVESAESMAGFPIQKVICSLSGGKPITKIISNKLKIENQSVEQKDLEKLEKINNQNKIDNYLLLSSTPIKFVIDNNNVVDNPVGMHTDILRVDLTNIYGNEVVIKNVTSAVELCHLLVERFIITPEASGISCMVKDERYGGATIIDIGETITSIGVFVNNKIIFSDSIPIGGVHLTSDIVRGLGTKAEEAEKIKILHGSAQTNELDEFTNIQIPVISEDGEIIDQQIPKAMLTAIIKPRIEEIFEIINKRLSYFKLNSVYMNKIILSGGGANLNNIRELASNYFNSNVRIGRPIGLIGLPDIAQTPAFACLSGLLIKSLEKERKLTSRSNPKYYKYFGKVGNWFQDNL